MHSRARIDVALDVGTELCTRDRLVDGLADVGRHHDSVGSAITDVSLSFLVEWSFTKAHLSITALPDDRPKLTPFNSVLSTGMSQYPVAESAKGVHSISPVYSDLFVSPNVKLEPAKGSASPHAQPSSPRTSHPTRASSRQH